MTLRPSWNKASVFLFCVKCFRFTLYQNLQLSSNQHNFLNKTTYSNNLTFQCILPWCNKKSGSSGKTLKSFLSEIKNIQYQTQLCIIFLMHSMHNYSPSKYNRIQHIYKKPKNITWTFCLIYACILLCCVFW